MNIVEVTHFSTDILEAINDLLPQLSTSAIALTEKVLTEIIQSETSHLLMAEEGREFYGTLTLLTFKIPTGVRAWVEDVVVAESARGKGVGKLLAERAVSLAGEHGAKTVDLTSRPSREAANALYKKVGFSMRETNVYRYKIT